MRIPLLSLSLAALWPVSAHARNDTVDDRHVADLRDIHRVDVLHPEAAAWFDQGDAAYARRDFAEAARLFGRAAQQAPESALLARRLCQAQTDLGMRLTAIDTCKQAMRLGGSPMDMRALTRAIALQAPNAVELSLALQASRQAKRAMPDQPWGYAADCDLAIRLGDQAMFDECRSNLLRVAPKHYETWRLSRIQPAAPWLVRGGWLLLALGVVASGFHAARRALGRTGVAIAVALLVVAPRVHAGDAAAAEAAPPTGLSKWPIDHQNPVASVPTPEQRDENPIQYGYFLMDLGVSVDAALEKNDYAQAAKYYDAMAKAVPDQVYGYRKACENHQRAGARESALTACAAALLTPSVELSDYLEFSKLQMNSPAPLTAEQIEGLNQVVQHLERQPNGVVAAAQVECELGTRLEDVKRLKHCASVLAQKAPTEATTFTYRWALALQERDFDGARKLIAEAKQASVEPKAIEYMEHATAARASVWNRLAKYWKFAAALSLALGALALVLSMQRRRDRLPATATPG
ncbi:MAG: hypothetical protein QM756_19935 [Polyangiaceae bacterium]